MSQQHHYNQFSSTGFPQKNIISQDKIKLLIKDQVFDILLSIKQEIQTKVKQIDLNIVELKTKIQKVEQKSQLFFKKIDLQRQKQKQTTKYLKQNDSFSQELKELSRKIQSIQQTQNQLKQIQQQQILFNNSSRNRSMEKLPLLKKVNSNINNYQNNHSVNLSKILFGEEGDQSIQNFVDNSISPIKPMQINKNSQNQPLKNKKKSPKKQSQKITISNQNSILKPPLSVDSTKRQNYLLSNNFNQSSKASTFPEQSIKSFKSEPNIPSYSQYLQNYSNKQENQNKSILNKQIANQETNYQSNIKDQKILQSMNKNKNCFLRKKSHQNVNNSNTNTNINSYQSSYQNSLKNGKNQSTGFNLQSQNQNIDSYKNRYNQQKKFVLKNLQIQKQKWRQTIHEQENQSSISVDN